jgi:Domain of unknown function (DUF4395)
MDEKNSMLSPTTKKRLMVQGYNCYSDAELSQHQFGIRFAYYLCDSLVLIGLLLSNLWILAAAMFIAFLGWLLPRHPFDYLYNSVIRKMLDKPELPPRTKQVRFACGIATVWLAGTILLFHYGLFFLGYLLGGLLVAVATLVATTDICIPSMIYNALFKVKTELA